MKTKFSFALITLFILNSCQTETPPVAEKEIETITEIQEVDSSEIVEEDSSFIALQEEVLGLSDENKADEKQIDELHADIKYLQTENDSLKTSLNQKNKVISTLLNEKNHPISQNEMEIRGLIQNLNKGWSTLIGAKDNTALTSLFLPSYAVSMVSVDMKDQAQVKMMLPDEFEQFANSIRKLKDVSMILGNVDYIYFDGREDVYSIVYNAVIRIYRDGKASEDRKMVATVTVKRSEGEWKIGKYSWVTLGTPLN